MTLVERFIQIGYWPTSRKTVLWASVLLPIHLFAGVYVWFEETTAGLWSSPDGVLAARIVGWGLAALLVSIALALRPALRGDDARWTAWVFVLLYSTPVVPIFDRIVDGIVFSYFPIVALFATVFFEERLGAAALLYMVGTLIAFLFWGNAFEGLLDIALGPVVPEGSRDLGLRAVTMLVVENFILIAMLCVLMVSARRVQERRLAETRDAIRRFVPAQVADAILAGRSAEAGKHERRKLTIFFSDLVGFTDISEELEPEDLSRVLNEYFAEMMTIAHRHGGTVDELSGDAILVFFGAPHATSDKDHALRAVRMALEMQAAMPALNARWAAAGITESLRVRMGINTGVVTIGNFGSPDRMKYAALGKHVNVAARIQAGGEPGKVVISHATWLLVQDRLRCTPVGEVQLKGIQKPVMTYVAEAAADAQTAN